MRQEKIVPYRGPAGGWGSARAVAKILVHEKGAARAADVLANQNKPGGMACVSCAWAKPAQPHALEFCENGAKATAWETTGKTVDARFFAAHTLAELRGWSDHALEDEGRLTEPLRWDPERDKYVPVDWQQAFAEIGRALDELEPAGVVFYTSGRASLETSYMYQLLARVYGNNNLPDSSNMCHESTSIALPQSIGVPVGTVTLEDFGQTDCILFFGQNVGSNSPRMLHVLQAARQRGVPIITFNPLRERGLERFRNPQSPAQMATGQDTDISVQYHQVRAGGDIAALAGLCKAVLEADDAAAQAGAARVVDTGFLAEHTAGYEAYLRFLRETGWEAIEHRSGLSRKALQDAAGVYAQARRAIGIYGMGLTQHVEGVANVQMLVNLLLMRGNIGKPGAGVCPVRGRSNVQGQRTVGITENPELAPLDRLAELYGFEPPRSHGLNTVATCEGIIAGRVRGFVGLGGNFARAAPDTGALEPAFRRLELTVHVATKLNRSHLLPGRRAYLLPCLGRSEIDRQASGAQTVSVEDSTGCIHASEGQVEPIADTLMSEPAIVAGLAQACVADRADVPWAQWAGDYREVRAAIERTWPTVFADYEQRMRRPGGFPRPNPARERRWETDTGRANFIVPPRLSAVAAGTEDMPDVLQLLTLRSNDQFNTTVYGYEDRFRGIVGTRQVVLLNRMDMQRMGLADGDEVELETALEDGRPRRAGGLRAAEYDVPPGCCAGYYPELNVLIPVSHHARHSGVPAAKSVPVRVHPAGR